MTPPQRDELGVITRDPTPTPIPVPDKGPECTARTDIDVQGIVEFLYLKAKPKGVELIEMAWGYAGGQDVSAESLPYRETFSHNPLRLHFREEDRSTSGLRLLIAFSISRFAALRKTKPL
jgi:hypothetical protein